MRKSIKLFTTMLVLAVAIIVIQSLSDQKVEASSQELYVYNWGDYIEPELIDRFEQESGYKVIYETFDSNESMYVKVNSGSSPYDVIFPSEYMVDKMAEEHMLVELDKSLLPNLKNVDPYFLDQEFDEGNTYSVPYFWGTVGIAYNTEIYDQLELDYPTSYQDLWNPGLVDNVLLLDGAREIVGSSLNSLGYSLNSTNDNELNQAKQNLLNLAPNVKGVVGDEIKMLMANNEAAAAIVWAGDAQLIQEDNENIEFITPQAGSNIYLDNIAIPKTSSNIEGAHEFINFLMDNEVASINTDYVGYASPITSVMNEPEHIADETYYPSAKIRENLEYYANLDPDNLKRYNNIFLEFKISL
ncbi:spermidine/putrescine ABC transporter substrate-binding protein [Mollicutes bacterium LVI A0078]|nr:spermidine/putrescine ABC transporter substrate-binding protein [Mollicutes bacterium LVI A0075]WOO90854.1 spermidine/putrescine ABC transporter substrate-binding protein [Mollicutes bacterium LVI A0078]